MTDVAESEQLLNDTITLEYETAERSGALQMTVKHGEQIVHAGVVDAVARDDNYGRTQRGTFKNEAVDKAKEVEGLDASDLETALKNWFSEFVDQFDAASAEMRGEIATEIINGTETPVEIVGAAENNTTYNVTLTFRGRTNTVEFDADAMIPGSSPGALQSALAHQFFEPVDVPKEDWEDIREYWTDANNTEVVRVNETTPLDAKADRTLEYLTDTINPTPTTAAGDSLDVLRNAPNNALVVTEYEREPEEDVDIDQIVWVRDKHLVDEIDSVADVGSKGNIISKLRERGEMVDKWRTRRLTDGPGDTPLWGFTTAALDIDASELDTVDETGGVDP